MTPYDLALLCGTTFLLFTWRLVELEWRVKQLEKKDTNV